MLNDSTNTLQRITVRCMTECEARFDISSRDEQYTIQVAAMNNKGELVGVPVISKVNSE